MQGDLAKVVHALRFLHGLRRLLDDTALPPADVEFLDPAARVEARRVLPDLRRAQAAWDAAEATGTQRFTSAAAAVEQLARSQDPFERHMVVGIAAAWRFGQRQLGPLAFAGIEVAEDEITDMNQFNTCCATACGLLGSFSRVLADAMAPLGEDRDAGRRGLLKWLSVSWGMTRRGAH